MDIDPRQSATEIVRRSPGALRCAIVTKGEAGTLPPRFRMIQVWSKNLGNGQPSSHVRLASDPSLQNYDTDAPGTMQLQPMIKSARLCVPWAFTDFCSFRRVGLVSAPAG